MASSSAQDRLDYSRSLFHQGAGVTSAHISSFDVKSFSASSEEAHSHTSVIDLSRSISKDSFTAGSFPSFDASGQFSLAAVSELTRKSSIPAGQPPQSKPAHHSDFTVSLPRMPKTFEVVPVLARVLEQICQSSDEALLATNCSIPQWKGWPQNTRFKEPYFCCFESASVPNISIENYLKRIVQYTKASDECLITALLFIDRLISKHAGFTLHSTNFHRLFLTAALLSSKTFDDSPYNNTFWGKVGGVSAQDLFKQEKQFVEMIDWKFDVNPSAFKSYFEELQTFAESEGLLLHPRPSRDFAVTRLARARSDSEDTDTEMADAESTMCDGSVTSKTLSASEAADREDRIRRLGQKMLTTASVTRTISSEQEVSVWLYSQSTEQTTTSKVHPEVDLDAEIAKHWWQLQLQALPRVSAPPIPIKNPPRFDRHDSMSSEASVASGLAEDDHAMDDCCCCTALRNSTPVPIPGTYKIATSAAAFRASTPCLSSFSDSASSTSSPALSCAVVPLPIPSFSSVATSSRALASFQHY